VHPDDLAVLKRDGGRHFRNVQQVLAAAGGDRKPVLDLVEEDGVGADE
jgi:hypothetical protein